MISKEIHLIWDKGFDNLPPKFIPNIRSIEDNNPGWKINKWDDNSIKDLLYQVDKKYLDIYNGFSHLHQRVDYFRYVVLYQLGGVSVDVDCFAFKGFDHTPRLSDSDFIVSKNSNNQFINNATILLSKGNPLMKKFIGSIDGNCNGKGKETCIFETTGPNAFTRFVNKHKGEITVLDNIYFEPCSGMNRFCTKIQNATILDHRHEGTWVNPYYRALVKAHYWAIYNKEVLIIIALAIILLFAVRKI